MKSKLLSKIISACIALCIVATLMPVYAAEPATGTNCGVIVRYRNYNKLPTGTCISDITYDLTENFFRYHSRKATWNPATTNFRIKGSSYNGMFAVHNSDGDWYALELNIPQTGIYDISFKYAQYASGRKAAIYIMEPGDDIQAMLDGGEIQPTWTLDLKSASGTITQATAETKTYSFDENEDCLFVVKGVGGYGYSSIGDITLNPSGNKVVFMGLMPEKTELNTGETITVKPSIYMSNTSVYTSITDWKSSDESIATVSTVSGNAEVTAHSAGTVEISANVTYNNRSYPTKVTLTVSGPAAVKNSASIAIDDDGDGKATVKSAELGTDVAAEAKDLSAEGKVFRGWFRGSRENGRLVSTEKTYAFKVMTNTYLTAIYTDAMEGESNEYYNRNGEFLGNTEPTTAPQLIGYTFANAWDDAGIDGNIRRFIAKFIKNNEEFLISGDDSFEIVKEDSGYDSKVICKADNDIFWYRDGKLVDYGKEYEFYIWDATNITTSEDGNDGAKIMLDKKKGSARMIEYDAGSIGKENILEVGILFGKEGTVPEIFSCEEKMSSQRDDFSHGQFAAASDYPVARGYLIYNDNGTYRVIYAD